MLHLLAGTDADKGLVRFERHRPEQTLLYKLVEQYYSDFEMQWASEGRALPDYVRQEFDEYLKCGRLEYGFLRAKPLGSDTIEVFIITNNLQLVHIYNSDFPQK